MNADHPDVRIEVRFKNARLYNAIVDQCSAVAEQLRKESRGYGPLPFLRAASMVSGVSSQDISNFLCLRENPLNRHGQYRDKAVKLADALGVACSELFPLSLYALKLPRLAVKEVHSADILSLQQAQRERLLPAASIGTTWVDEENGSERIANVLHTLSPREEKIINLRFGLNGNYEHSLDEVAQDQGVTFERIRQIENKALRKLRHPSRSRELEPLLDAIPS